MIRLVPRSYRRTHGHAHLVELASERVIPSRNTVLYRTMHWPVWVFVFFLMPGPVTFTLFASGVSTGALLWLAVVVAGTAIAAVLGKLPGTEPRPYVLFYGEDTPNPPHRRICYTAAWGDIVSYALLNLTTLAVAVVTGAWRAQVIFQWGYFPIVSILWIVGILGQLPRARRSTQGEGIERRQFYGSVWAVTAGQVLLLLLWKTVPVTPESTFLKFTVYVAVLAAIGHLARRGFLPRTRPIVAGTVAVSD